MELTAWGQTDKGASRKRNDDSVVCDAAHQVYMVADGVGRGASGDVASSMATEIVHQRLSAIDSAGQDGSLYPNETLKALSDAINDASAAIYTQGDARPEWRGMATTALAIKIQGDLALAAHVGDSRLYLVREGRVLQMTEDHTLLQRFLDSGTLTPEEAEQFPHKNVLARSVGVSPAVQVDTLAIDIHPGDQLVLCTDGISDVLDPDAIGQVASHLPARQAVERLIAMAKDTGSSDNLSAVVVKAEGDQPDGQALLTEKKTSLLAGVFLFNHLSFQELLRVLAGVRERNYSVGDLIIREGDESDAFFILVEGAVEVRRHDVVLARIEGGGHFGELGLISEGSRSASVVAVEDAKCLSISREDFDDLVSTDQGALANKLLRYFLENVAGQLKSLSETVSGA